MFRTTFDIPKYDVKVDYENPVIMIGSCFAENIGNKAIEYKLPIDINPFGILYNPLSVMNSIRFLIQKRRFTENEIEFFNDKWFSYYHHSRFSNADKKECLDRINNRIESSSDKLRRAKLMFITFGTARVYELKESGMIVSNCHKKPGALFRRFLLDVETIVNSYKLLTQELKAFNPELNIVFTLSPIRHLKDGTVENLHSKSVLLVAIHSLRHVFDNVEYFPSYELIMDDLRDYRFYARDMIHLSDTAVDYVWDKFADAYINDSTKTIMDKVIKIVKASKHHQENINLKSYQTQLDNNLNKIANLEREYPFLNFEREKSFFLSQKIS